MNEAKKKRTSIGLKGVEALHFFVHDLERMQTFLGEVLDLEEVGGGEALPGAETLAFRFSGTYILVSRPVGDDGPVANYLDKHPEGVGEIRFGVKDIEHTLSTLEGRGATPVSDIRREVAGDVSFDHFAITTPFGSTRFRFIERGEGGSEPFPGFVGLAEPRGGSNRFGFTHIDHITSNFRTLAPALLWMEHVMGLERYWGIEFHTSDVTPDRQSGSGLKSTVMWDPESGVKFANNEPWRPFFAGSQISLYIDDNRGDGVQHAALSIHDIMGAVRDMRQQGVPFMPTPGTYYDALPERIIDSGIMEIDEAIGDLRELQVLIDGERDHRYLLQIFLKEMAAIHDDPEAGPFFFEIIQRKGDRGFGGGNFRALFESIERDQKARGRI